VYSAKNRGICVCFFLISAYLYKSCKNTYTSKKGKIIILDGVSRSGKTSIANRLVKLLGPSWQKIERDDFMASIFIDKMNGVITQEQLKVRIREKTKQMYKIVKNVLHSGKNVVFDTVLSGVEGDTSVKQAFESLKLFEVYLVLVYCPLHIVVERLKHTNMQAVLTDNTREMRPVFATLQFVHMYRPKECDNEIALGTLSAKDIEISYDESKQELQEIIARLKKVQKIFFAKFGFDKQSCIKIVPQLVYDFIIDTSRYDQEVCAEKVGDFILQNGVAAFGLNCEKWGI